MLETIKIRILLFLFFAGHAVLAVFWPRAALEVITDHNRAERARRAIKVGDKL